MLTKNKNWLTNKRTSCILISNKEFPAYRKVVEMSKKISTKSIILIGMFAAVLAVMAQISIPMPSGVPITLQTFGVALTGTILGHKLGTGAVFTYLAIEGVGMPVFSNMSGGFASFVGKTGGFLIGFLFMVWFCGFGVQWEDKKLCLLYNTLGLVICHICGTAQFSFLTGMGFWESALLVSVPYFIKDGLSVIAAIAVGSQVRKRLASAGLLERKVILESE